jgi:hypothetical protein
MLRELAKAKAIVGQDVPLQGRESEERVEREMRIHNIAEISSQELQNFFNLIELSRRDVPMMADCLH